MFTGPRGRPLWLKQRSNTTFIVCVIGIALFTDLFLYGLIVPILPFVLEDRLHVPKDSVQSTTSVLLGAYAGATVLASPIAGVVADRVRTRQAPFVCGLVALSAGTALQCFGRSVPAFVIARVSQGMSAAVVWTIGLAMIMDTVGSENLGKTIGSIFSFISIGELAAPLTGGVVYKKLGYYGVFAIAFSLLAADLFLRFALIEKKTARRYLGDSQPDSQDFGISEATNEQTSLLETSDDLKPQSRATKAFPLLTLLKDPGLLAAFWLAFMQALVVTSFDATIPTEVQRLFNFDSLKASILFAPLTVPYLIVGPLAGTWVDKSGPKSPAVIGYLALSVSLLLLGIPRPGGTTQIVLYSSILVLCGASASLVGASSFVQASQIVEHFQKKHPNYFGEAGAYGALYGVYNIFYSLGMLVGPLLAGGLRDAIGYQMMNMVIAFMCLITSVLSFCLIGQRPRVLARIMASA